MTDMTLDQIISMADRLSPAEQATLREHLQPASSWETQSDEDLREWGMMLDQMCGGETDDPM